MNIVEFSISLDVLDDIVCWDLIELEEKGLLVKVYGGVIFRLLILLLI